MTLEFGDNITEGKYISFSKAKVQNPSTWIYTVQSNDGYPLGTIKWYAQWRQYGFYPNEGTVYEKICLTEIAEFCRILNVRQKAGLKPVQTTSTQESQSNA